MQNNTLINDSKVPVTINGQTVYVSQSEASKFLAKVSKDKSSIAVENPSPVIQWQGKTLICE